MGKKGKKAQAGKPKKLTPKNVAKRLDALVKKVEEELKDADLFAPLPPTEDCAICCVPLPRIVSEITYHACCGNDICFGCVKENEVFVDKQNARNAEKDDKKVILVTCAFCRAPTPSAGEEYVRLLEKRSFLHQDREAMNQLGNTYMYSEGDGGVPKDGLKALDYWIKAAEFGSKEAFNNIGQCFREGILVAKDYKKGALMEGAGAIRGLAAARHNVDCSEYYDFRNYELGIRHWKVAAKAGYQMSLNSLRKVYNSGGMMPGKDCISKSELDNIYRLCHQAKEEVNSEERQKHRTEEDNKKYSPRSIGFD